MPRLWHTITRRKWFWTLTTAALFTLWISTGWFLAGWQFRSGYFVCATDGRFCLGHTNPNQYNIFGFYHSDKKWWSLDLGFEYRPGLRGKVANWDVLIPLWSAWLPTAALAITSWRRHIQLRRSLRSLLCHSCGYPRQGLAPHAPCPECGKSSPTPA